MNSTPLSRPTPFSGRLTFIVALIALLGMFIFPYATYGRDNTGAAGILLRFVGGPLDLTGFNIPRLPDLSLALGLGWAVLVSLGVTLYAALRRESWLWISGLVGLLLSVASVVALERSLAGAIAEQLAQNVRLNRIIYVSGGANLGMALPFFASLVALIAGISAFPAWRARLERLRGALIPLVSILLAIVVGAVVVLLLQSTPVGFALQGQPLSLEQNWFGKADLVWFVYTTLFAPLTNWFDLFTSLLLATPLILVGLSVAFAFRAGLFNIGAPGQMVMGALAAAAVGLYVPLPGILLTPLAILAAIVGGGLWGALVGWLKARFGSSEVINTIMLNYIAASLLIFLIGSNEVKFFGQTYTLPFKAEGFEPRSEDVQAGAQLPTIAQLLGLDRDGTAVSLAPLAGLLILWALAYFWRGRNRWPIAIGGGVLATALLWFPLTVQGGFAIGSVRFNTAFIIAQVAVIFFGLFLWRTAGGFEVRAVGLSPKAAEYGGINVARNTVLAMFIAGAFAGLTGTHYVLGAALGDPALKQSIPTGVGFDGITIALLGQSTPLGVVIASIFFGVLDTGGLYADQKLDAISKDIVTALKALIVLFIAAQGFLSRRITNPPPQLEGKVTESSEARGVTA